MPATDRRGITLFETVAALAIVSMTAVSAVAAVGGELRTAERARRAIEADVLAKARLDFMNLMSDQDLQAIPDSVKKGRFDPPLNEYSWETAVSTVAGEAGVYDVTIAIAWPKNSYTVRSAQYRRPPLTGATP